MNQYIKRFLKWFLFLFSLTLVFNVWIKADPDIWTALSCSLGISLGIAAFKPLED